MVLHDLAGLFNRLAFRRKYVIVGYFDSGFFYYQCCDAVVDLLKVCKDAWRVEAHLGVHQVDPDDRYSVIKPFGNNIENGGCWIDNFIPVTVIGKTSSIFPTSVAAHEAVIPATCPELYAASHIRHMDEWEVQNHNTVLAGDLLCKSLCRFTSTLPLITAYPYPCTLVIA